MHRCGWSRSHVDEEALAHWGLSRQKQTNKSIPSLREMFLPPSQNIVRVCHQITLLILYCGSSRMLILLKVIGVPIQVSNVLYLTVRFRFNHFSVQIFLLSFLKCLLASRPTLCKLATLFLFAFCNHSRLDCFTPVKTDVPTNNSRQFHNMHSTVVSQLLNYHTHPVKKAAQHVMCEKSVKFSKC